MSIPDPCCLSDFEACSDGVTRLVTPSMLASKISLGQAFPYTANIFVCLYKLSASIQILSRFFFTVETNNMNPNQTSPKGARKELSIFSWISWVTLGSGHLDKLFKVSF